MLQGLPRPVLIAPAMVRRRKGTAGTRAALSAIALLVLLAFPVVAFAAAPGNDDPFDPPEPAFDLVAPTFLQESNAEATTYDGEPLSTTDGTNGRCQDNGTELQGPTATGTRVTKTLWWTFSGTGGPMTVSAWLSDFDTVLTVWTLEGTDPNRFFVFQKCNDDVDFSIRDLTSELVLNTIQDQTYYVQVGGCSGCTADGASTRDSGTAGLYLYPPPANDRRASAQTAPLNTNVAGETWGALVDSGERTSCTTSNGTVPFAKTAWYRVVVPKTGTLTLDAGGYDTAVTLYPGSSPTPVACNFNPSGGTSSLSRHLGPGTYLAQVGGVGNGVGASRGDLNFKASFVGDPPPPTPTPSPAVTPAPTPIPPTPTPRIASTFEHLGVWGATGRFTLLDIVNVPAGAKVQATCKGKGCKKKRIVKRIRTKTRRVHLAKALRRDRRLHPGAVVEVRVTAPGRIGKVFRFRIRAYKPPALKTLCLRPGATRPGSC
jgi:hypothetical protein